MSSLSQDAAPLSESKSAVVTMPSLSQDVAPPSQSKSAVVTMPSMSQDAAPKQLSHHVQKSPTHHVQHVQNNFPTQHFSKLHLQTLPVDVQALLFSFNSTLTLTKIATSCKSLNQLILHDTTYDTLLYRTSVLRQQPSIVLSAMEKNATTSCKTWLQILKIASLHSIEFVASETSDRAALKKPNQSRSVYVIRIEAGGNRFVRLGGHYFFKIGFSDFDQHVLDTKSGKITGGTKWIQPRVRGKAAAPLRGFSLTSLAWNLTSLAAPVSIIFGGADTAYPFLESNALMLIVPLLHASSKTTQWLWLRGNAVGSPPPPRRGCSATAISNGRQIVFIGGSVTSPCQNFDDVHVLDTRGNGIEMELDKYSNLSMDDIKNKTPETLSGMTWSKIEISNRSGFTARSAHVAMRMMNYRDDGNVLLHTEGSEETKFESKTVDDKHPQPERILIYGGFQLGGKTSMWDCHSLVLDTDNVQQVKGREGVWNSVTFQQGSLKEPEDRTSPATFLCGRKMLLMGGHLKTRWKKEDADDSTIPVDVLVFDPLPVPHWYTPRMLGNVPPSRCGAGLSMIGPVLLMSGGYESSKKDARAKLLKKEDSMRMKFGP